MAKMISLDGFVGDAVKSFKDSVKPVDVLVGAGIRKVLGPVVDKQLNDLAFSKVDFLTTNAYGPAIKKFLGAAVMAFAAYALQKGNARAKGHVVGIVGIEAIEFIGEKVSAMLPASLQGLVEYNGYGLLSQDNAYGLLSQDNAYGAYSGSYSGEPTASGMAEFADWSNRNTEVDPEAEYAG